MPFESPSTRQVGQGFVFLVVDGVVLEIDRALIFQVLEPEVPAEVAEVAGWRAVAAGEQGEGGTEEDPADRFLRSPPLKKGG